jgi:hypothetical protein
VCNVDITPRDLENEMILGPVTIWAHMACYMIWREESCLVDEDGALPGVPRSRASENA